MTTSLQVNGYELSVEEDTLRDGTKCFVIKAKRLLPSEGYFRCGYKTENKAYEVMTNLAINFDTAHFEANFSKKASYVLKED